MISAQEVASRSARPGPNGLPPLPRGEAFPQKESARKATPAPSDAGAGESGFTPSWETQKQARTYLLGIPAPRSQIVDRHGNPLAQTRVSYNLAITFPSPSR